MYHWIKPAMATLKTFRSLQSGLRVTTFRQEFKATHLIKRTQCPVVIIGNRQWPFGCYDQGRG